ncbi:MAG: hypothetical protein LQ341_006973, partial [Variospora aurantia]
MASRASRVQSGSINGGRSYPYGLEVRLRKARELIDTEQVRRYPLAQQKFHGRSQDLNDASFLHFCRNAELQGQAYRRQSESIRKDAYADLSTAEVARRGQRRFADLTAYNVAIKPNARDGKDVKNETNKDGSGKGQMAAWKGMKISKEYEKKGGSYENEAGSDNKPTKGAPEPKSDEQKEDETKDASDDKPDDKEKEKPKANSGKKATGKK